ncbi:pseudaminic acid synthase [Soehngenia longivitae]|uniref:Pseudaminic acid synthase n=1 Tax=Soehngenia longivitae TaxID=2562294 RepID=A0A4Z0D7D8_9FIRM|nr:pseudaminic acid synthase [Soehngenia longivitae]TFZ40796.1 pseudaminic acid synthase [Soehngenia longivitae]
MKIKIDTHTIVNTEKTFVIAELSANHGHDINIAKKTIKAAKESGADAIKIQTYTADTLTIDCDNEYFKLDSGTIWDGRTLYDLYSEAYTPWEWQRELMEYANSLDLIFFSTPFDKTAVDFLEELNVPLYKVASFEIMDIPLIEYIASKGKPVIISTGVATLSDIEEAVNACKRMGNDQIILLKCTSSYPAKIEDANLNTIPNMKETFGVEVGLSDHTLGITVPIVSIALGARVIEKHFILDKSIGGPDASFSLEPNEFKQMVEAVRDAEKALGKVDYSMNEKKKNSRIFGRSLFVVKDIKAGETFTEENVRSIRPSYGLAPKYFNEIINRKAATDIARGTPLSWDKVK